MREAFRCPTCDAEYVVERVEAAPTHKWQVQVICVECGGPLRNREGKFALKYRRTHSRPDFEAGEN
jgi:ssDNA-binding Zn-finger/Zn-ribbon topoisomerase 1